MSMGGTQQNSRFFYGWWIVFVAAIGLFLSYASIILYSFGGFFKSLATDFKWSRAQISLALSISLVAMTIALPFIGRLMDRVGARRVIVPSAVIFGLSFMSLAALTGRVWQFYLVYLVLGIVGGGLSWVPYCSVISCWFDKRRGLALALAMVGAGLGSSVMPSLTQTLIVAVGWRTAYLLIGLMVPVIVIPVVGLFFKEKPEMMGLQPDGDVKYPGAGNRTELKGMTTAEALRSSTFWIITISFFLVTSSVIGCLIHLTPMLTDRGISAQNAAFATSLFGGALMIGRVFTGYLLDRFFASYVAAAFFLAAGLGMFLLWSGVVGVPAFIAAFLIGMGVGAEGDVITYQVSRYFGLRSFGEIYGYVLIAYTVGGMVGPLLMGLSFDYTGSYRLVLGVFLIATAVAVGLLMCLKNYDLHAPQQQSLDQPHIVSTTAR
jgi:MFS family permease